MKNQIFLLILILHFTFYILHLPSAYAESISLSVSPSLYKLKLSPPAESKSSLTLQNQGTDVLNVNVFFKPFRPDGELGLIAYSNDNLINPNYQDIFNKIKLTDEGIATSHFKLGPKQKKKLELRINIPKEHKDAEYYFSVIFEASVKTEKQASSPSLNTDPEDGAIEDNPQEQNISTVNAAIAANILLSIITLDHPQASIIQFSTPFFIQSGPAEFTLRVKNIASHFITPRGAIFIKNMFGQTIDRIDIEAASILSNSIRSLGDTQSASSSSNPKIIWPEKFLLGPYTADLSLAISEKGPIYHKSIYFLALPIQFTISFILAILIIITIILRVKYRLKIDK